MHDWERVKDGTSSLEKLDLLKGRARKIEMEAQRKEQLMKVTKTLDVPASMECNDMLIDAIKAKLTVLDNI